MRAAPVLLSALLAAACSHECHDLAESYDQALRAAQACDPAAATSCDRSIPGALDEPVCPAWVDAAREPALDEIVSSYAAASCQQAAPPACAPSVGRCERLDDGSGRCVAHAPGQR
ncbi:MAG TPA: hypothetical protein VFP65_26765 [Anaeromyxobacteraceae bacterium]|nr:hypothetical protein [Anaeromyxobacteraceae bacterium]